jgi:hypothetical protein
MRIDDVTADATVALAPTPGDSTSGVALYGRYFATIHYQVGTSRVAYALHTDSSTWIQVLSGSDDNQSDAHLLLHGFSRLAVIGAIQVSLTAV